MKAFYILLITALFLLPSGANSEPGQLLIHLPGFSEKQTDSIKTWLSAEINILQSGICLDNKLLVLQLKERNTAEIDHVFALLKKHGIGDFYLKDEISEERIYQECHTFIAF